MKNAHCPSARPPQRIAIVRALRGLGDLLCAVPAWRTLRAAWPAAHISLIGLPEARPVIERFAGFVDELIEFPGFPGIPERELDPAHTTAFLEQAQQQPFDLALQMHGSGGVMNPFTMLLGARRTAGFYLPGQYCPDQACFWPYPEHEPEVRRNLRLLDLLGLPLQGEELEFPVYAGDRAALAALSAGIGLQLDRCVCLHAGAHDPTRRWPPEYFAAVGDDLARQGFQVVLTGSVEESAVVRAVQRAMTSPAVNLAGRTDLGVLAALLEKCRLLVCNDTGVSHLAAALRTPSVVVFLNSDAVRWAPLDRERHRPVGWPLRASVVVANTDHNLPAGRRLLGGRTDDLAAAVALPQDVLTEARRLLSAQMEQRHAA